MTPGSIIIAVGLASLMATASLAAQAVDPDLPQPLDVHVADSLIANSPFTRALDLSDSLELTGIAFVEGKPVVTLMNRTTKESFIVSEEPNAQGWKLAETNASRELKRAEVKIMTGAEIVTVRYGDAQLTPEAMKGSRPGQVGGRGFSSDRGGDNRPRTSSYLGEGGRDRYRALSDGARDKFRDLMRKRVESRPNDSEEAHSAFAKKEFQKIEDEDKRNRRR